MSHDYHEALPGFHESQILHDGCRECEQRAKSTDHGISNLDPDNFARAWDRAAKWVSEGLGSISEAEIPLLSTLSSVQLQLGRSRVSL